MAWNKGKTKEEYPQLSNSGVKKGNIPWNKGVKIDRNKFPNMGHFQKHSEETIQKISQVKKENPTRYWLGKTKPFMTGDKNPNWKAEDKHPRWKGGISRLPYPFNFNKELKELIRKRDNYKCRMCECPQEECVFKLEVHHIDYNKENLNSINLLTLCKSCHSRTNEQRDEWVKYFKEAF